MFVQSSMASSASILTTIPKSPSPMLLPQSTRAPRTGGVHVNAVMKDSQTYEHVSPALVGNHQRVLVSDLSGRSNVLYQLQQQGLAGQMTEQARKDLLERVKEMEFQGYDLEAADGTFELFVRQSLQPGVNFFDVEGYEVHIKSGHATATVRVNT